MSRYSDIVFVDQSNSTGPRRRWTTENVEMLVDILVEFQREGRQSDSSGFRATDFAEAARIIAESDATFDFDAKKLRSKYDDLKKIWRVWSAHLAQTPQWSKNSDDVPVNTPEIEDEYFRNHSDFRQFRKRAPAFRKQLEQLFGPNLSNTRRAAVPRPSEGRANGVQPSHTPRIIRPPPQAGPCSADGSAVVGVSHQPPVLERAVPATQTAPPTTCTCQHSLQVQDTAPLIRVLMRCLDHFDSTRDAPSNKTLAIRRVKALPCVVALSDSEYLKFWRRFKSLYDTDEILELTPSMLSIAAQEAISELRGAQPDM